MRKGQSGWIKVALVRRGGIRERSKISSKSLCGHILLKPSRKGSQQQGREKLVTPRKTRNDLRVRIEGEKEEECEAQTILFRPPARDSSSGSKKKNENVGSGEDTGPKESDERRKNFGDLA